MDDKNTIARQMTGDPLIRHGAEMSGSFIDEATIVPPPASSREIPARLDNQRSQARDIKDRLYALAERASHDNWMAEKVADGWVYGEVKDPAAKTHPCIVPFDQLPPEQQFKDRLFATIVRTCLSVDPRTI